jgi:hypothetical protein
MRRALVAIAAFAAVVVPLTLYLGLRDGQDDAVVEVCARVNVVRAYLRRAEVGHKLPGYDHELAAATLPIVDCRRAAEDKGKPATPLKPHVQRRYIELVVVERRWPVVEDGSITDTRPLPGDYPTALVAPPLAVP